MHTEGRQLLGYGGWPFELDENAGGNPWCHRPHMHMYELRALWLRGVGYSTLLQPLSCERGAARWRLASLVAARGETQRLCGLSGVMQQG